MTNRQANVPARRAMHSVILAILVAGGGQVLIGGNLARAQSEPHFLLSSAYNGDGQFTYIATNRSHLPEPYYIYKVRIPAGSNHGVYQAESDWASTISEDYTEFDCEGDPLTPEDEPLVMRIHSTIFTSWWVDARLYWGLGPDHYVARLAGVPRTLHHLTILFPNSFGEEVVLSPPHDPDLMLFPEGASVVVEARPDEGYRFSEWLLYDPLHPGNKDFATPTTVNPVTVVMDTDREIQAIYQQDCGSGLAQVLPLMTAGLFGLFLVRRRHRG